MTAYVSEAAVVPAADNLGDGREDTIALRAVFGTEVSIDDEFVRSAMRSRSGVRLSMESRPARGPRLVVEC